MFLFFPLEIATFYNHHKGIQGDNRIHDSLGSDTEPLLRQLVYSLSLMEELLMAVVWSCPTHSQLHRLKVPQAPVSLGFPSKKTGVGCHFLPKGIFLTQGSNPCLLHWQVDALPLSPRGALTNSAGDE